jgi:hypothetical protein
LLQFGQKVCKGFGKCKSYNAKTWGGVWVVGMDYMDKALAQKNSNQMVLVCVCVCTNKCYMIVDVGCQRQTQ